MISDLGHKDTSCFKKSCPVIHKPLWTNFGGYFGRVPASAGLRLVGSHLHCLDDELRFGNQTSNVLKRHQIQSFLIPVWLNVFPILRLVTPTVEYSLLFWEHIVPFPLNMKLRFQIHGQFLSSTLRQRRLDLHQRKREAEYWKHRRGLETNIYEA